MKQVGYPLRIRMKGQKVADLHEALIGLGLNIADAERTKQRFGASTRRAVSKFQAAQAIKATGVVDRATAGLLNRPAAGAPTTASSTYVVSGVVSSPDSASVGGLNVQLVDKNVGADVPLGTTTTNSQGKYQLSVVLSPASLQKRQKTAPDLQARVSAGQTFLAASTVQYNAAHTLTLDVALPTNATALSSEYETLTAALKVNYTGQLGDLQENASQQDVTFLANKTGWDARAVALAALADQFSRNQPASTSTSPASAVSAVSTETPVTANAKTPATGGIRPEFYYALFRAGLPANANGLYQASPQTVGAIWKQAIAQGVIPSALASDVDGAVQTFQTLSAGQILSAPPPVGISTLQELLQTRFTDQATQQQQAQQFADLYTANQDNLPAFWSAVEGAFGSTLTQQLQLDGQISYLTLNNAPLMGQLYSANRITSAADLVTGGYYLAAKWAQLVQGNIPSQIPGTGQEQLTNYTELLAAQVRLSFPTAVVGDMVNGGVLPIPGDADGTVRTAVTSFLGANQGFEIGMEPVERFLARNNLTGTISAPAVAQIKRLQRVYQITPNDQAMTVLLQNNLDSAYEITRYDAAAFVRNFADAMGGETVASQTYVQAQMVFGAVLNIASTYLTAQRAYPLGSDATAPIINPGADVTGSGSLPTLAAVGQPAPVGVSSTPPVLASATLEGLFGSMDFCSCDECRSILSPAAYLVDLLQFIDCQHPQIHNPQEVLFNRRPDIPYLPLTCDNTNTALPYIDLVNETLEYFVANNLSLANYQGHNTDDTVTSEELLANPQFVNDTAYSILQTTYFPPPLPFHRPLELLRLHLQKIGVELQDVMAALRPSDAFERGTAVYGWRDILMEQLGLSRDEYTVLTDSSTVSLQELYGYPPALSTTDCINALSGFKDYSRRVGVSYDDLVSILKTRFINPNSALIPRLQRLNIPFATLQALQNGTITDAAFTALLPAGLDPSEYGASLGAGSDDYQPIVDWVKDQNNYGKIMDIITIANPTIGQITITVSGPITTSQNLTGTIAGNLWGYAAKVTDTPENIASGIAAAINGVAAIAQNYNAFSVGAAVYICTNNQSATTVTIIAEASTNAGPITLEQEPTDNTDLCTADTLWFRYANPVNTQNTLDAADFTRLLRFIRLWRKLGLTIEQTDAVLTALYPALAMITVNGPFAPTQPVSGTVDATPWSFTTGASGTVNSVADALAAAVNAVDAIAANYTAISTGPVVCIYSKNQIGPNASFPHVTATGGAIAFTVAANDSANLDLLDEGFLVVLPRIGTVFQVMDRLNLMPKKDLLSLLACWAPIGTAGDQSLYQSMFLTPALLREDPGAQIAAITAPIKAGDMLNTTINGVTIPHQMGVGESPQTAATTIAAAINGTTTADPIMGLPLNQVVFASGVGDVITIKAGFTLACSLSAGAQETYSAASQSPIVWTATVGGVIAVGDMLTTTINGVAIPCTVTARDTSVTILAGSIAAAINNTTASDPATGLPLNRLVVAVPGAAGQITVKATSASAPFTLECSLEPSYEAAVSSPVWQTATITGVPTTGDVLVTTINGVTILYPVAATDTTAARIAGNVVLAINGTATVEPVTGQPLNEVILASNAGGVITVQAASPLTSFTMDCSLTAGSYTAGQQSPALQTATITGLPITGSVLVTTINGVVIAYTVAATDTTAAGIATNVVLAINGTQTAEPVTGLPLNHVISSSSAGGVITVQAASPLTAFTMDCSLTTGGYTAGQQLPTFADDGYGDFLQDGSQLLFCHEPVLRAAFNLTGAEFDLITTGAIVDKITSALDFDITTPLTLENISAIYRRGWLARALNLSVLEFLLLTECTGLDPFATLDLAPATPAEPPVIRLVRLVQELRAASLKPVQALYLMWNQDISGKSAPPLATITGLARTLRGDFDTVESQFTLSDDPNGDIAEQLMTLVYGSNATNFLFGLLNNTFSISTEYANPQPALPQSILHASSWNLSYDDLRKQLTYVGVLDTATFANINTAIANPAVAGYVDVLHLQNAVAALNTNYQKAVAPFFAQYPELLLPVMAYVQSRGAPENKRATLLDNFLPVLKKDRKLEQALADATAAAGADPGFAPVLLNDPTILHAATDGTAPIIDDLTAIESPGLSAEFYLNNDPTSTTPPDITVDAAPLLSYSPTVVGAVQTATIDGTIAGGNILTTTINNVAIPYTVLPNQTVTEVAGNIAAAIKGTTTPDPVSGLPLNCVVSAANAGDTVTIQAFNTASAFALVCSLSPGSYTAASQSPSSPTATVAGAINAGDVLTTAINGASIPYTAAQGDTVALIAGNIAAAINSTTTPDPVSGLPLNRVVLASNMAGVITINAVNTAVAFTLVCSLSPGPLGAYTAAGPSAASQTATVGGASITVGDGLTTTINGVTIPYQVAQGDNTAALIAGKIAAAINTTTTTDPVSNLPLNRVVVASSAGAVITVIAVNPASVFTLACSPLAGATETYAAAPLVPPSQTATITGAINPGDVLNTTINNVLVPCGVAAGDSLAAITGNILSAINGTATTDPVSGLPLNQLVHASSAAAGVVTITALKPNTAFTLACAVLAGAYTAGGQPSASQTATISGPLTSGNVLTTTINGVIIPCTVVSGDMAATVANRIVLAINATATPDPVSGRALNLMFLASSAAGVITINAAGATFALTCSSSQGTAPGTAVFYTAAGQLPAAPGGGAIAGVWSGYLDAPQDGFYDIDVTTDPGATVALMIDETAIVMVQSNGVWSNQTPISLVAGALSSIVLTVTTVTNTLAVSWESTGLGWQVIPGTNLYSETLVDRLQTAYVRFLKATSLATALKLTATEIADLAGYFQANTTDNDLSTPGVKMFTPGSMDNINVGSALVIDVGATQETVTVTAVAPTTFTATTVNPHDGTVTPFPVVSVAAPAIGQGWLNFLSVTDYPDAPTAASLRDVLSGILQFARFKAALSPKDERLLDVLENPALQLANGDSALLKLTGWNPVSLNALLTQFFGNTQLSNLGVLENFRRVYDAFALVKTCGISAAVLIAATTNDPTATTVNTLQSALRALYAQADWLAVIKPINDTMRDNQRDALVAYVLQQLGDQPATSQINTADKLFEYFLMDVQMEPCMETSRIRHALSSVQLFIERCLRNLEPLVAGGDLSAVDWTWMKRYRVWQANREVFLWPENWLYPELRDDQSQFFKDTMSELLQSDITDDTAEVAYLNYLSKLEEVAKLEPCGIFYHASDPNKSDDPGEFAHIVARTAGAHRKYYYCRLESGSWTPWEQIKLEIEDNPVLPVVWKNRLLLFWLKILKQAPMDPSTQSTTGGPTDSSGTEEPLANMKLSDVKKASATDASQNAQVTVNAVLCWSEYYNGKWQPAKTSDANNPALLGSFDASGSNSFNRSAVILGCTDPSQDVLQVWINGSVNGAGFRLYNTHSLPVPQSYIGLRPPWPPQQRKVSIDDAVNAPLMTLVAEYDTLIVAPGDAGGNFYSPYFTADLLTSSIPGQVVLPQSPLTDGVDAPFFFADSRNVFYVTTAEQMVAYSKFPGYGLPGNVSLQGPTIVTTIPPLVLQQKVQIPNPIDPVINPASAVSINPAAIQQFVGGNSTIRAALNSVAAVQYGGQKIGLTGSVAGEQLSQE